MARSEAGGAVAVVAASIAALGVALGAACGGDDAPAPPTAPIVTTEHCAYLPVAATAGAGGTVTAGPLRAGASERILHVPVGTALGGYTNRASVLGASDSVDVRDARVAGSFVPSIGVTTAPRVKALALSAGGETVVWLKADMIFAYEGLVFDIEAALGPAFAGKVLLAASHSHSAWAQFTGHAPLQLGAGPLRDLVYRRFRDDLVAAARDALAAQVPARLGIATSAAFDPDDAINRDRRRANDGLPGGARGDDHLALIRVDRLDGAPLAVVPIFGAHPTLNGADNPLASADASGALERVLEEELAAAPGAPRVVVMHVQGAGADSSAVGHGEVDCAVRPGSPTDPCFAWTAEEGHGLAARDALLAAWTAAGSDLRAELAIEMVTRSIELGPTPEAFAIRDGALTYAAFDGETAADGVVHDGDALASPIDEFNAPVGAALCEGAASMFPTAAIAGTEGIAPYGSCLRLDLAAPILGPLFDLDFGVDRTHPVCETTRTTVTALRLGDHVIGTLPGEVSILLADLVRARTPAPGRTIVVGYAQGHVGYLLRPEDWVLGGYEPSVTFWGPLEAEMIAERLLALLPLALTPAREDAAAGGTTRVAVRTVTDVLPLDALALDAGSVPAEVPLGSWSRTGTPGAAQPNARYPRVAGIATFVWYGDDPLVHTPRVALQRETAAGFVDVVRRSGRPVIDGELVLSYTPSPLVRGAGPQRHVWIAEWQTVPWLGASTPAGPVDALADRAALPLGRYRFMVAGASWELASEPFTVVPGGLVATGVRRAAGVVQLTAALHAPRGWRLLDPVLPSNRPVPLRARAVTVELRDAGGAVLASAAVVTGADGAVAVPDVAGATEVRVTDAFANQASAPLP